MTGPDVGSENPIQRSVVELYGITLDWQDGAVTGVTVRVEFIGPDTSVETTSEWRVDDAGRAHFDGFAEIDSLVAIRTLPAAEMAVRSVDAVRDVDQSLHHLEDELDAGHQAVDNRLEDDDAPADLRRGYDAR